jgi:Arc/MetJ-type ribon-helix-helix transcriptional regulator
MSRPSYGPKLKATNLSLPEGLQKKARPLLEKGVYASFSGMVTELVEAAIAADGKSEESVSAALEQARAEKNQIVSLSDAAKQGAAGKSKPPSVKSSRRK